jgi:hypothetical protein
MEEAPNGAPKLFRFLFYKQGLRRSPITHFVRSI